MLAAAVTGFAAKSRPVCHVMSAPIAGRVGLDSCSYICLKFGVPTTYTRVNDFGQHMDSIVRGGATYTWERLIGEYIR